MSTSFSSLDVIRRLFGHLQWADALLLRALELGPAPPAETLREYGHILGADELWLSRLEQRPPNAAVWPEVGLPDLPAMVREVHAGWARYLEGLDQADLSRAAAYTNSAGQSFRTPVEDILLHLAMHAHYHRGKINVLLRQAGLAPAPADYISFIRGAPAATTPRSGGQ